MQIGFPLEFLISLNQGSRFEKSRTSMEEKSDYSEYWDTQAQILDFASFVVNNMYRPFTTPAKENVKLGKNNLKQP